MCSFCRAPGSEVDVAAIVRILPKRHYIPPMAADMFDVDNISAAGVIAVAVRVGLWPVFFSFAKDHNMNVMLMVQKDSDQVRA